MCTYFSCMLAKTRLNFVFCLPLPSLKQVGGSVQVRLRRHTPFEGRENNSFQDICVMGDTNKSLSLFNLGGNEVKVTNVKKNSYCPQCYHL